MMTNTTNTVSEIQFQMAAGASPKSSSRKKPSRNELQGRAGGFESNANVQSNAYDFDNFGNPNANKGMFSTFSNPKPQAFNDFNFDMPP